MIQMTLVRLRFNSMYWFLAYERFQLRENYYLLYCILIHDRVVLFTQTFDWHLTFLATIWTLKTRRTFFKKNEPLRQIFCFFKHISKFKALPDFSLISKKKTFLITTINDLRNT